MKRFFVIIGLTLLFIASVNIYVDPAYLIKWDSVQSDESRIADIFLDGKSALVPPARIGFNERISRKIFLENKTRADESVVFGSSRVRYFSSTPFNSDRHFVDAVNAATLEDFLVFTYLRERRDLIPKYLTVALDPWMIEKSNEYTHHVQLSYPYIFAEAVDHYGVAPPSASRDIYKGFARTDNLFSVSIDATTSNVEKPGNYDEHISGKIPLTGKARIGFEGKITFGANNWAWRVLVNGKTVDSGTYMSGLGGEHSPHEYRTMLTGFLNIKKGDVVSLDMAHANNEGESVPRESPKYKILNFSIPKIDQKYKIKNFSVNLECSDSVADKYKGIMDCGDYIPRIDFRSLKPIVREMISPAYFEESIKNIFSKNESISSKEGCDPARGKYIFCSDGGIPNDPIDFFDFDSITNLVRTIDDGLIPLKTVDEDALQLLRQITQFYQSKGTAVTYLLVPVHPFSYNKWKMENDSRGFILAEKTYREAAKANGVPLVGSYDPAFFGCNDRDFKDWVHPLPRCANMLAKKILSLRKDDVSGANHVGKL